MNSSHSVSAFISLAVTWRTFAAAAVSLGLFSGVVSAQVIDPDPEIFDGSDTKRDEVKQEPATTVDDWEGPNLIIYDAEGNAQGSGGTGFADGKQPGLDIQVGLPNPLGLPLPIPLSGGGAGSGDPSANPLQIPVGQQSAAGLPQQQANTAGAAQSASRPSDVSIGDPSKQIATTAQGQAGNVAGVPEPGSGEEGAKKAGEDSTQIPSSANTAQTGVRGGGTEKGDAMPSDM
jgi:hypothetical protein